MKKITSICLSCFLLLNMCCVSFALTFAEPELLWYEDFDYGTWNYSTTEYPDGYQLQYMNNAKNNSDTQKGFSSGWTFYNGNAINNDNWLLYTNDNHASYQLKTNKFSVSKIQRTVDESKRINLDEDACVYNIGWEQYFDENALRTGNNSFFITFRAEDSSTGEIEIFKAGVKTTGNTLQTRLNLLCDTVEKWGSADNVLSGGKTYQILMRIETSTAGNKDEIRMKAYPVGEAPKNGWDLEKEIVLNGMLDVVHLELANTNSAGASKDIRLGNLWAEKLTAEEAEYIEETETLLETIKGKLSEGKSDSENISAVQMRLDAVADSKIKTVLSSTFEKYDVLNDVALLVEKAIETGEDADIEAAQDAVDTVTEAEFKSVFEDGIDEAVEFKNSKDSAIEAVEEAESNAAASNAAAAQALVDELPDGSFKTGLLVRLAPVWVTACENEPTGENLTAALNVITALPESSDKQGWLLDLLEIKVGLLENEATPSKADYDAVMESIEALPDSDEKDAFLQSMESVKSKVAITYAPEAVATAESSKTTENVEHAREWVALLADSDEKDALEVRLDNIEEAMEIRWIYDNFDYEANTPLSEIADLNSENADRGFSTGWMTTSSLTSPINSAGVKTDGNGFILFPGANSATGLYRGLSRKIDLTQDDEYYISCKIMMPANASTNNNRAVKLEFTEKGAEQPFFMAGLIGNGSGQTFFVKDNNRLNYTARAFSSGKTYNLKIRITSSSEVSDRFYSKLWEVNDPEPAEWMLSKNIAVDTEIDVINFSLNFTATYGFADLLVEKYTEGALSKLYVAESAVTTALTSKTESEAQSARNAIAKLPDSLAKTDMLAKLRPLEELLVKKQNVETELASIENTEIIASNADSIQTRLDNMDADITELEEAGMADYTARLAIIQTKIYKVQAERDKSTTTEWKGNKTLTEGVDEAADPVVRYAAIPLVKGEEQNNYYIRFTVTPRESSITTQIGDSEIIIDSLTPNVSNTVVLTVSGGSVKKQVGTADANGNLTFTESTQTLSVPETTVFGITSKNGSVVSNAETQKVNSDYATLIETELASLSPASKLADIESAQRVADSFANSILKDLLLSEIAVATASNKNIVPAIDILSISGINQVGQILSASVSIIDAGGNFKEYQYSWTVNGNVKSTSNTLSVTSDMANQSVTLTVTPFSIHSLAGTAKSVSTTILPGESGGLGTTGGTTGGGGGGGGGNRPATEDAPATDTSTETQTSTTSSFVDLRDHWAKADVEYMASLGHVTGTSKDFFAPDDKITRAEFATLLSRILGLGAEKTNEFTDVTQDSWYNGYIGAVLKAGVLSGYGDGLFKPDENVTREEMAKGIMNAYTYLGKTMEITEETVFADASEISTWATAYVRSCYKLGIMVGDDNGNFRPRANATRAEATVVLKRVITSK